MSNTFKTGIEIGGADTGATKVVDQTAGALDRLNKKGKEAEAQARSNARAQGELTAAFRQYLGVIGVGLGARAILRATVEQEDAYDKLRATLQTTGGAIGYTVEQLDEMASTLQRNTRFSDDAILSAQGILAEYTRIGHDIFPRVQRATLDLGQRLRDLSGAAELVGKSMQEATGIDGLNRRFKLFDETGVAVIRRLFETGQTAKAQDIVLSALEGRVGGLAETARDNLGGALAALKNQFGDLIEGKGHSVTDLTASVNELTGVLSDDNTKQAFETFAGASLTVLKDAAITVTMIVDGIKSGAEWMARLAGASANSQSDRAARIAELQANISRSGMSPAMAAGRAGDEAELKKLEKEFIFWQQLEAPIKKVTAAKADHVKTAKELNAELEAERQRLGILTPEQERAAAAAKKSAEFEKQAAAALKQRVDAIKALWDGLDPATAAQDKFNKGIETLSALGPPSLADLRRYADLLADDIVGGLDAATAATRTYEGQVAQLENQLDLGLISPERFDELQARAKAAMDEIVHGSETAGDALQDNLGSAFDDLKNTLVDLSSEWGKSAAQIVNGLERVVHSEKDIVDARKNLAQLDPKEKDYNIKRVSFEKQIAQLEDERLSKQIGGFAALTDGAQSFFKEGSKGYQTLGILSEAFHAAELAATIASTGPAAVKALVSALQAPPPYNFVSYAAVAAILAGLGIAVGGVGGVGGAGAGSGPQVPTGDPSSGTGSVLGDITAQSESIKNSLDLLTKIADQDLSYSAAQLQALRSIDSSLRDVGIGLARNFAITGNATPLNLGSGSSPSSFSNSIDRLGGLSGQASILGEDLLQRFIGVTFQDLNFGQAILAGLFGGSFAEQIDSGLLVQAGQTLADVMTNGIMASYFATIRSGRDVFFGHDVGVEFNDQTAPLEQELANQLSDVLSGLGTAVLGSIESLGLDVDAAQSILEGFDLGLDKISLQGLTAAEVSERLTAVFSSLGDRLALDVLPAIADFQRVGEGALETLIRVSAETQAVVGALDQIGTAFGTLTGLDLAHAAEDLIDAAGGLENLASGIGGFYDAFFTDDEKIANATARMNEVLGELGLGVLPSTRDGFRDLVTGLDLTTEAGRNAFVTLTGMSDLADQVYSSIESAAADALQAQQEAADAAAQAAEEAARAQQQLTENMQAFVGSIEAVRAAITGTAQRFSEAQALANLAGATSFQERAAAGNTLAGIIQQQYNAEADAITKNRDAQIKAIQDALQEQIRGYQQQAQAQDQINQQVAQAQMQAAQNALAAFEKARDAARGLLDWVQHLDVSEFAVGSPQQQLENTIAAFQGVAAKVRGGDADAAGQAQQLGQQAIELAREIYGSAQPALDIFNQVRGTTIDAAKALESTRPPTERTLRIVVENTGATNEILERQIAAAQAAAQHQIDEITGNSEREMDRLREATLDQLSAVEDAVLGGTVVMQNLLAQLTSGNTAEQALLSRQVTAINNLRAAITGGQVAHFGSGGVVTSQQLAVVGEVPEVIIPLQGGAVPVRFLGNIGAANDGELLQVMRSIDKKLDALAASQPVHLQVDIDSKPIIDKALGTIMDLSRRGHTVVKAAGVKK